MRPHHYDQLCALARRECRDAAFAEDAVQEALIAAFVAGRDLADPGTARWLRGVVRNQARMTLRSGIRRRHRETAWATSGTADANAERLSIDRGILDGLPPALRAVAALALSGHTRREIGWLLRLPDTALRQRITALKRHLAKRGATMPDGLPGLGLDLPYGRLRAALAEGLTRRGGHLATHDPDGHLFVVRVLTNPPAAATDGINDKGKPR